jgi:hypothetical protein
MKLNKTDISPLSISERVFKMCLRKKKYASKSAAKKQCYHKGKELKYYMKYYTCPICKSIHIARDLDAMWKKCKKTS